MARGPFDVLIDNAGINRPVPFVDVSKDYDDVFGVECPRRVLR